MIPDTEVDEMPDQKFKRMMLKMIHEFKEDTNKQLNELRKTMQHMKAIQ